MNKNIEKTFSLIREIQELDKKFIEEIDRQNQEVCILEDTEKQIREEMMKGINERRNAINNMGSNAKEVLLIGLESIIINNVKNFLDMLKSRQSLYISYLLENLIETTKSVLELSKEVEGIEPLDSEEIKDLFEQISKNEKIAETIVQGYNELYSLSKDYPLTFDEGLELIEGISSFEWLKNKEIFENVFEFFKFDFNEKELSRKEFLDLYSPFCKFMFGVSVSRVIYQYYSEKFINENYEEYLELISENYIEELETEGTFEEKCSKTLIYQIQKIAIIGINIKEAMNRANFYVDEKISEIKNFK